MLFHKFPLIINAIKLMILIFPVLADLSFLLISFDQISFESLALLTISL
jgi:hypothetical protein